MDWDLGYKARYYAAYVDPGTWRDKERFEIISGSVSRENADLRESAELTTKGYPLDEENWIRVWLDTSQNEDGAHIALFTGLATSPSRDIEGRQETNKLECYSVLKPAEDVLLSRGWYAPVGMVATDIIRSLLSVTPAPVEIEEDAPKLMESIVAEDGESNLSMTDKILNAIGWRIKIHGDGIIELAPKATEEVQVFDPLDNDVLEPSISVEHDWYECPNVFMAIADDVSAVARDDEEDSDLSTVNRGREVWLEEDGVDLADNESIAEYAQRKLKEEQQIELTASYKRRFDPDVFVGDIVKLKYPGQGLDGKFEVTSQDIELGYAATTSEDVKKV